MNRYAQAKAELEQALVVSEGSRRVNQEPARYAAISVMQPWAWLIAHAPEWPENMVGKTIENRSQPTNYRGPVLIHVSRTWAHVGEQLVELRRLGLVGRGCPEPNIGVLRSQLGLVIAVAELVGCRRIGSADAHPWASPGAWGWELEDIELVRPFGLRGHRGLWLAPRGVSVRRMTRRFELADLPISRMSHGAELRINTTTGYASVDVSSYREAVRVLLRAGVTRFNYVVRVNGTPVKAGELLAKAAAEFGDDDASRRILAAIRSGLVDGISPEFADRGPRVHGCMRGRNG